MEYLEDLRLGRVLAGGIDEDDLIVLEKWQVPAVVGLTVSIGQALEPGVGEEPTPPPKTPVPLPVEVC